MFAPKKFNKTNTEPITLTLKLCRYNNETQKWEAVVGEGARECEVTCTPPLRFPTVFDLDLTAQRFNELYAYCSERIKTKVLLPFDGFHIFACELAKVPKFDETAQRGVFQLQCLNRVQQVRYGGESVDVLCVKNLPKDDPRRGAKNKTPQKDNAGAKGDEVHPQPPSPSARCDNHTFASQSQPPRESREEQVEQVEEEKCESTFVPVPVPPVSPDSIAERNRRFSQPSSMIAGVSYVFVPGMNIMVGKTPYGYHIYELPKIETELEDPTPEEIEFYEARRGVSTI